MNEKEIIAKFKEKRLTQIVITIALFIALAMMFFMPYGTVMGFLLIVFLFIKTMINWRYPSCRTYLGRGINLKKCHKCGVSFVDEFEKKDVKEN